VADAGDEGDGRGGEGVVRRDQDREEEAPLAVPCGGREVRAGQDGAQGEDVGVGDRGEGGNCWGGRGIVGGQLGEDAFRGCAGGGGGA
jgi:hypothetical protein